MRLLSAGLILHVDLIQNLPSLKQMLYQYLSKDLNFCLILHYRLLTWNLWLCPRHTSSQSPISPSLNSFQRQYLGISPCKHYRHVKISHVFREIFHKVTRLLQNLIKLKTKPKRASTFINATVTFRSIHVPSLRPHSRQDNTILYMRKISIYLFHSCLLKNISHIWKFNLKKITLAMYLDLCLSIFLK